MLEGWRSTQTRLDDGTVLSVQRIVAPAPVVEGSEEGARRLGRSYWLEVARASRGLVRCRDDDGGGVELRPLGLGPRLLAFGPAEVAVADDLVGCRYPIIGGLLARRPGGTLSVAQFRNGRVELRAAVEGFLPRRGPLYQHLQRRAHVAISRRYFRRLLAEAGP